MIKYLAQTHSTMRKQKRMPIPAGLQRSTLIHPLVFRHLLKVQRLKSPKRYCSYSHSVLLVSYPGPSRILGFGGKQNTDKPVLGGVRIVALFIYSHEQTRQIRFNIFYCINIQRDWTLVITPLDSHFPNITTYINFTMVEVIMFIPSSLHTMAPLL